MITVRTVADLDRLPPAQREAVRAQIAARARHPAVVAVRGGVCDLLAWYRPDHYRPVAWHRELGAVCDGMVAAAVAGRAEWHMLGAPPRHGKSEHVGRAMGPRAMALRPGLSVLYATSTEDRAVDVSMAARGMVEALHATGQFPHLAPGRPWTTTEWRTRGGNHWVGVGAGSATGGIGAHMIIPDDVTGSDERQASGAWKRGARTWLQGDVLTRDAGGAVVCLMETRRGLDDMQGWVAQEWPGAWAEHTWRCLGDDGAYLWSERYGEAWHRGRPDLAPGTRVWETQYQQRPYREGGSVMLEAWMGHRYPGLPRAQRAACTRGAWVCVDPAGKTAERNDPSGIVVIGLTGDRRGCILHAEAERRAYPELRTRVRDLCAEWQASALVEDTSTGLALIPDLRAAGVTVEAVTVAGRGDKVIRMQPHLSAWAGGMMLLPESAPWVASYVGQMTAVPDADHDDLWDATSIWHAHQASTTMAQAVSIRGLAI